LASQNGAVVAAVHAGWRGLVAGVIGAAVRQLQQVSGEPPATFVAAVGPCISVDHFEVGPEVLKAFAGRLADDAPIRRGHGDKGYVDLRRATMMELVTVGVPGERIDTTDRCTYADSADFFSHRRDAGVTGRMAALIVPRGKAS
jgi:YfiH family protein